MGVLPLQFRPGETAASLKLTGRERFDIVGMARRCRRAASSPCARRARTARSTEFTAIARIDTPEELVAYRNGGILPYVLRQLVKA